MHNRLNIWRQSYKHKKRHMHFYINKASLPVDTHRECTKMQLFIKITLWHKSSDRNYMRCCMAWPLCYVLTLPLLRSASQQQTRICTHILHAHTLKCSAGTAIQGNLMFSIWLWSQMPTHPCVLHDIQALVPVCPCVCLSLSNGVCHKALPLHSHKRAGLHFV